MPRELIAVAPRAPELREYEDPPLEPAQIRIVSELASPKHGAELVGYRNDPVASRPYDPAWGAVMPRSPEDALNTFPMNLGNMTVGVVSETGTDVTRFRVGDRVFGHFPIRETHTVDEAQADLLPDGLSPEAAHCLDPVVMALAIRDAGIKLGAGARLQGLTNRRFMQEWMLSSQSRQEATALAWKLAEAKNKLSEVANKARDEGPQFLTRRDEEYVLLTKQEYLRLSGETPGFLDVLRSAPDFDDLDLERVALEVRNVER